MRNPPELINQSLSYEKCARNPPELLKHVRGTSLALFLRRARVKCDNGCSFRFSYSKLTELDIHSFSLLSFALTFFRLH